MGLFDGILLVSDFDGTLAQGEIIPEANREAVGYFMQNGGSFSVGSGRYQSYLKEKLGDLLCNAPLICCNGAVIMHQLTGEKMFEGFCTSALVDMIRDVFALGCGYHEVRLYYPDREDSVRYTPEEFSERIEEFRKQKIYKALLHTDTPENGKRGSLEAQKLPYPELLAARSWDTSLELMMRKNAKDAAVGRLKSALGAKLSVTVGDYENDIPMLRASDLSYAVRGGSELALAAAKKVCAPVEAGAVADVISDLEAMLRSGKLKI